MVFQILDKMHPRTGSSDRRQTNEVSMMNATQRVFRPHPEKGNLIRVQ